jgi:integrase
MKAGTKWNEEGLVFPSKFGGPLRESNLLERVLAPAAEVAGAWARYLAPTSSHTRFHSSRYRHTCQNCAAAIRHASIETTLNIYTHAIPDTHRRATERLEAALFPVVPKCSQAGESGKEREVVIH